jgi:VCBS repeat-containing protein
MAVTLKNILGLISLLLVLGTVKAATVTVANTNDTGAGSLRQAVTDAAPGDTIVFNAGLSGATITLGSANIVLSKNVTIDGSALASQVKIDGGTTARDAFGGIFYINNGVAVTLKSLTLQNGNAGTNNSGGAIYSNGGTLSLQNSTFAGNKAMSGGAIAMAFGILDIAGCTFVNNDISAGASNRYGGAIYEVASTTTITNSTFYGNTAGPGAGGAIYFIDNTPFNYHKVLTNNTFSGNTAGSGLGGAVYADYSAGGLGTTSTLALNNNLFAANTGGNIHNTFVLTAGTDNVCDDATCVGATQATTAAINLQALASNGGPTQTRALGLPSVARGAGTACPATDQRGVTRHTPCDVGAFQTLTVTNTNDSGTGSLRQAILDAAAGVTIDFAPSLNGQTITLASELAINKNLSFIGNGVSNTIIDGNNLVRLFNVTGAYAVTWTDLTLTQGRANFGGCINATNGSVLHLTRVTANACTATNFGGALWGFTINLTDSTLSSNTASSGGGGVSGTTIAITNSTLSGNSATFDGGGIYLYSNGSLTLTNATLTGNSAGPAGGGIFGDNATTQTIRHSTITGNTAASQAGGIYSVGVVSLGHTILAGNTAGLNPDAYLSGTSAGYNRIGTIGGSFTSGTGDSTGVTLSSLSLGTLADNGGPTKTIAIGADSVALNAGDLAFAGSPTTDQRGTARVQGGRIDIGAYERANTAPSFVGATTTLTVAQSASATDITGLLHTSDIDVRQTLTWSQSSAPSHGTLSFTSATASSGSTDIITSGTITYTPTTGYVGADSFTVQVSDGTGSATRTITVTIAAPTITVSPTSLSSMVVGTPFSQTFTASSGYGSYTYSVSAGSLPLGLNLSGGGLLSGTPTTAGAYSFTVQATDQSSGTGPFSGMQALSVTVLPPSASQAGIATQAGGVTANLSVTGCSSIGGASFSVPPAGAPATFPYGLLGFTLTSCASGGTATVTVTYSQNLPAGATFYKYLSGSYTAYPATLGANSVAFTLTDGGAGDADGAVNSSITDPGGIGVPGGGAGVQGIPTLSEWGMIILSILMALFGFGYLRRQTGKLVA